MIITWEEKDIIVGRLVKVSVCNEIWLIGYELSEESYFLISIEFLETDIRKAK